MAFILHYVLLVVLSVCTFNVLSAPSITSVAEIQKESGCTYQNRRFKEGDKVPTTEPCLRCHCLNNNLVCRLRVCVQVPDPPPPGCFIVQHHNECCPKLVCNSDMGYSSGSNSIIEARSGSSAVQQNISKEKGEGCVNNGTVYAEGSAMDTSSLCEYCYCIKGEQHCVKPQCLLILPGCEPEYTKHTCCPTKYNCSHALPTTTSQPTQIHKKGCKVAGKHYPEGEMINGISKECENCYCVHGEIRCEPVICSIPALSSHHCSPVYSTGHCCPSSYKCTSEDGGEIAETRHYSSVEVPAKDVVSEGVFERKSHHSSSNERQITNSNTTNNSSSVVDKSTIRSITSKNNDENSTTITTTIDSNQTEMTTMSLISTLSLNDTESTAMINDITTLLSTQIDESTTMLTDENTTIIDNLMTTINDTNESNTVMGVPTDMTVLPTVTEVNENVSSGYSNSSSGVTTIISITTSSSFKGYNYTKPVGYISPDIEAIINITKNKEHNEDYEYDYDQPSLPPSLPNLRIIPFVAADAVVSKTEAPSPPINYPQSIQYPIIYEKPAPVLTLTTEQPIYYKGSHPNGFSPPAETEGGFVPREPMLDHPFYESKIDIQSPSLYHTPGYNVDITVPSVTETPTMTQPQTTEKRCLSNGRRFNHGELISEPTSCEICTCFFGEIICQEPKCAALQPGCIRLHDHALGCCGRIICGSNELDSPTRVMERVDHVTPKPSIPLQQSAQHLPPFTIADMIVTPDTFRDVIRTEPAPDLPSLMGDIIHLWEHSTPKVSSSTLPSITTGTPEEVAYSVVNNNNEIISNNFSTTNEPKINLSINSSTMSSILSNITTVIVKDIIGPRNTSNSMNESMIKDDLNKTLFSLATKKPVTNKDENTTPLIIKSTTGINNIKQDGFSSSASTDSQTSVQDLDTISTVKPSEINETIMKSEKPLILIDTTMPTTVTSKTEDLSNLKFEQKIEDDEEEDNYPNEDNSFSLSSMLDLFFNSGNSDTDITTTKPSPFKLTVPESSTTSVTENIKSDIKLTKNYTNLLTTTKTTPFTLPSTTVSKLNDNIVTNKTNVIIKNNSALANVTKSPSINKFDTNVNNTSPSLLNLTAISQNLKPSLTTENYGYPDRNVSLADNHYKDVEITTVNNSNTKNSTVLSPVQSVADPGATSGLLKLAGCNIYGRMYRVGRIISELSGPCLECMCTEVGVQCRPLPC